MQGCAVARSGDVGSCQRPSDRQGDVHDQADGATWPRSAVERRPRAVAMTGTGVLDLAAAETHGLVPRHGRNRRIRAHARTALTASMLRCGRYRFIRSGKRGSKRHLICDGRGVPLAVRLTGANRNDSQEALALVDAIPPLHGQRGRPRRRPDRVVGDRGYDAAAIRRGLRTRHIVPLLAMRRTKHGEWLGSVAVGRGAHTCLAESVSPAARAV